MIRIKFLKNLVGSKVGSPICEEKLKKKRKKRENDWLSIRHDIITLLLMIT